MKKINLRESLIKMDIDTDCKYDLTSLYESCRLDEKKKQELVKFVNDYDIDATNALLTNEASNQGLMEKVSDDLSDEELKEFNLDKEECNVEVLEESGDYQVVCKLKHDEDDICSEHDNLDDAIKAGKEELKSFDDVIVRNTKTGEEKQIKESKDSFTKTDTLYKVIIKGKDEFLLTERFEDIQKYLDTEASKNNDFEAVIYKLSDFEFNNTPYLYYEGASYTNLLFKDINSYSVLYKNSRCISRLNKEEFPTPAKSNIDNYIVRLSNNTQSFGEDSVIVSPKNETYKYTVKIDSVLHLFDTEEEANSFVDESPKTRKIVSLNESIIDKAISASPAGLVSKTGEETQLNESTEGYVYTYCDGCGKKNRVKVIFNSFNEPFNDTVFKCKYCGTRNLLTDPHSYDENGNVVESYAELYPDEYDEDDIIKESNQVAYGNEKYKGYMIRQDHKHGCYNIYDKNDEMEDSGFKSIDDAKKYIDSLYENFDESKSYGGAKETIVPNSVKRLSEGYNLDLGPGDIIVNKKNNLKFKILKPLDGRVRVLNIRDNIVSHISNDYLNSNNFYVLDNDSVNENYDTDNQSNEVVESYNMSESIIDNIVKEFTSLFNLTEAEQQDLRKDLQNDRAEDWADFVAIELGIKNPRDIKHIKNNSVRQFFLHCNKEDYNKLANEFWADNLQESKSIKEDYSKHKILDLLSSTPIEPFIQHYNEFETTPSGQILLNVGVPESFDNFEYNYIRKELKQISGISDIYWNQDDDLLIIDVTHLIKSISESSSIKESIKASGDDLLWSVSNMLRYEDWYDDNVEFHTEIHNDGSRWIYSDRPLDDNDARRVTGYIEDILINRYDMSPQDFEVIRGKYSGWTILFKDSNNQLEESVNEGLENHTYSVLEGHREKSTLSQLVKSGYTIKEIQKFFKDETGLDMTPDNSKEFNQWVSNFLKSITKNEGFTLKESSSPDQYVIDMAHDDYESGHPVEDFEEFVKILHDDGIEATDSLWYIYQDNYYPEEESLEESFNEDDIIDYDFDKEEPQFTEIESKQVTDYDGFLTDYTMYRDNNSGEYVFIFGDKDIYSPEDTEFDWSCDTEKEAREWFDNYIGFDDEEGNDVDIF